MLGKDADNAPVTCPFVIEYGRIDGKPEEIWDDVVDLKNYENFVSMETYDYRVTDPERVGKLSRNYIRLMTRLSKSLSEMRKGHRKAKKPKSVERTIPSHERP